MNFLEKNVMSRFEPEALRTVYDGFAPDYDRSRTLFDNRAQLWMLAERLPSRANVLDAGCGSGRPVLRFFADCGHRVTGTDISSAMLKLASRNVPEAALFEADSAALEFDAESFDLITSFYSLFHLKMKQQEEAFLGFLKLLRPGGVAYFTLACEAYTGEAEFCGTKEFSGVELPYSHTTPEAYRLLFEKTGFVVESMEPLQIGGETMLWVLIRKRP
ncbi:MAG: class I SAM-dependent methyltransferase [Kiritimatiellales bacterium]